MSNRLKQIARPLVKAVHASSMRVLHINPRLVVFDSNNARSYTGNPRAIYEYMVARGLDTECEICWIVRSADDAAAIPGAARAVRYNSPAHLSALARARVRVSDSINHLYTTQKPGQFFIQTWHGTPLKKIGLDMESVHLSNFPDEVSYRKTMVDNARMWDCLVVQNDYSKEIFCHCFAYSGEILRTGYPRNDVLFAKHTANDIFALKARLGLPLDKKIILYAPTFRDDETDANGSYYFSSALDFSRLQRSLGREYVVALKSHYVVRKQPSFSDHEGFVYSFGNECDISDLYLVADRLITDYSSAMFDFSLLHKPMLFFCYDLERYKCDLRGFYFDFEAAAPGPISTTTEELLADILLSDEELEQRFGQRRAAFYQRFHTYDNGIASAQIAQLIMEMVNQ